MSEIIPIAKQAGPPALDFIYMLFQPNPQKEYVYFWLNGEKNKKLMRREEFYRLVQAKSPDLIGQAHSVLITYSFYLWSIPDQTITHLTPQTSEDAPYPDSLSNIFHKRQSPIVVEKKSIEQTLMNYGFSTPTAGNIQNLRVTLEKKDPEKEGFFARFLGRGRH